jgi:hypothetical protein
MGLVGVTLICAVTPFNNYVANNTDAIGSALPTMVVFLLLLASAVNGLLSRYAPRLALSVGEMGVALGMVLVACALPAVGLMRYLPGHLVQFHAMPAESPEFAAAVQEMGLPDWLWPTVDRTSVAGAASDAVVRDFIGRIPAGHATLVGQVVAVPWGAWVRPAVAWGAFVLLLFGAVLCLTLIFRQQWTDNERLPFPLATVYLSLIEPPAPGRAFNRLLASRAFWITFGAVFVVHGMNGLSRYDPTHFPTIPMSFNLGSTFAERPWSWVDWSFKAQTIYFTIIGIVYFADTRVALSLWLMYVLLQVYRMTSGGTGSELTGPMQMDQVIGAALAFGAAILWIARRHLFDVGRQMFHRPRRPNDTTGRYLPHAVAGWGLAACAAGLVLWLTLAGASVVGAAAIVGMLMLVYLVLARVVAETGLLYVMIPFDLRRPWMMLGQDLPPAMTARTTLGSYFFASFFSGVLTHDVRQAMPVFVPQAIRVNDLTDPADRPRARWPLLVCLLAAVTVAFAVSGAAMLWADYTYAASLDARPESPVSSWGASSMPRNYSMGPVVTYRGEEAGPREAHDRIGHAGFGAAVVAALSAMRLRYVGWPLHPVGFLLVHTWGIGVTWFSIFLGWVAKTLVIRLGGSDLFARAKPVFLGLIVGEASAAAFWLLVNLARLSAGLPYENVRLLPS